MVQLKWPNGLRVSRRPFENQHQLIEKTFVKIASLECSPTGWHSAAASAPGEILKNRTISRAKRSAALPGWAADLCAGFQEPPTRNNSLCVS